MFEVDALATLASHLEEKPHVDCVYCDVKKIDGDGKFIGLWHMDEPESLRKGSCVQACFMYRRSAYEKIGEY